MFAFSRDHGFPGKSLPPAIIDRCHVHVPTLDRGVFGRINKTTGTPLYAVWIVVLVTFLPGLLNLASPVAANAIFSLTAMGMCFHDMEL